MALFTCVMAWAGNQPAKAIEPVPFQFDEYAPAQKAAAPIRMAKAEVAEQDVLLEYEGFSQHFTSLQAAFNALPENSTPATVTLLSDIQESYNKSAMVVGKYHNVTLDLNGRTIYSSSDLKASSALIQNNGTLTITDSSNEGTGMISNQNTNPEDWVGNGQPFPYVAHNTITNSGTLNINAGTIMNYSEGGACYVVDNNSGTNDAILNISDRAVLLNTENYAIRQFCNSTTHKNEVNISGGEVTGTRAVWIQLPASDQNISQLGSFTMNGGTLRTTGSDVFYTYTFGPKLDQVNITVTGGDIYGKFLMTGGLNKTMHENVSISGGKFHINNSTWGIYSYAPSAFKFLSGGELEIDYSNFDNSYMSPYLKSGYCGVEGDIAGWTKIEPCNSQEVTESKTMAEIAQEIAAVPGQEVSASIIEINAASTEEKAVVTVNDDIEVEGIVIKNDNNKEGQIVVESGVTLTVGNSGIVSENNDLTTVVVKPGGTVIVGNGGVTKKEGATATPVEIQSTGTESGVFMVDPNASAEVAQAPAKVKVYTRAHKDNGIEYWQQFASPVKGDTIKVTPLGELQGNHNFMTSLYSWDYATDSWVRIPKVSEDDGMEEIGAGTGIYAFRGDAVWKTSDAVLKPFAAFDLINNSHASHGGVTYEFAGELVGNGDMELSFPENGFCTFGNSYTAPIDLESFFETVKNDIQYDYDNNNNLIATSAIDPCVYIFNSAKNCFESVNQAAIKLWKKGIKTPAFTQIPPQQAFVMNLLKGNSGQSAVNYAASVWGNPQGQNVAIKAPKRAEETSTLSALLEITVTDGNTTDRVMLIEDEEYSNEYDFGADAVKYMNGSFNLYANTTIGQLDMVASNNIENTELSFKAGNAVNYTISFNNVEGDFVLIDHANNSQVAIVEGGIYTFAAQPNATAEARFAVVPAPKMPTAIENTEVKANVKGIYTIMGQYLGENFDILPAGVYVIDGVKIVK